MINISEAELSILLSIIKKIIGIYEVRAFGSRLSRTAKTTADIDLVIMDSENPLDNLTYYNLKDEFENSDLRFRVDVIKWSEIDENFREIINRKYEILYSPEKQHKTT